MKSDSKAKRMDSWWQWLVGSTPKTNNISSVSKTSAPPQVKHKVVVVGASMVGKTSIFRTITKRIFFGTLVGTMGVDLETVSIPVDRQFFPDQNHHNDLLVCLHDTETPNTHQELWYYRDSHAGIFVYDISRPETLDAIPFLIQELKKRTKHDVIVMILGNKTDSTRKVAYEIGLNLAKEQGALFCECSTKHYDSVLRAFVQLSTALRLQNVHSVVQIKDGSIRSGFDVRGVSFQYCYCDVSISFQE
jgi:GTPase SAR1 family protein